MAAVGLLYLGFMVIHPWIRLKTCGGNATLPLNGFVSGEDRRVAVPEHLYDEALQLDAGIGSIKTKGLVAVTNSLDARCHAAG